jgi:hypothetical protein
LPTVLGILSFTAGRSVVASFGRRCGRWNVDLPAEYYGARQNGHNWSQDRRACPTTSSPIHRSVFVFP